MSNNACSCRCLLCLTGVHCPICWFDNMVRARLALVRKIGAPR